MKKLPVVLGVALGFALLVTGCETDALSARIQEKSAVYATLKPWQKKYVDTGVVAMGFTPDMVYMAIGNPTKTEIVGAPENKTETWTYKNYYPTMAASNVKYTLNADSGLGHSNISPGGTLMLGNGSGGMVRASSGQGSISATGGPQGGSMEPADLQSYTFVVTLTNGVVTKMKLDPN
jgi:hypothetical protein